MFVLAENWWAVILRGIAAVIFGVLCFAYPGITLAAMILLFGIYAIADGLFNIVASIRGARAHQRWGALLLSGIVSLAAGIYTMFWPGLTAVVLLYVIAYWAIATGILGLITAFKIRKHTTGEWRLALSALLSIALGIALIVYPGAGALAFVLWYGVFAVIFGAALIALGVWLRSLAKAKPPDLGAHVPA